MKKWILAGIVLAVVLGGLYFAGAFPGDGFDGGMGVTFLDNDGNVVDPNLAYMRGGSVVTQMKVKVSWSYTGANLVIGTLETWGTIKIDLMEQVVPVKFKMNLVSDPWVGQPRMYSYFEITYDLAGLLPDEYRAEGWLLRVSSTLFGSIQDDYGNKLEDNISLSVPDFTIYWDDLSGDFSIGGSITA